MTVNAPDVRDLLYCDRSINRIWGDNTPMIHDINETAFSAIHQRFETTPYLDVSYEYDIYPLNQ